MSTGKPRVMVLFSGGTIGMKEGPRGLFNEPGAFSNLFRAHVIHRVSCNVDVDELPDPIDSANATPHDWRMLAERIGERYSDYDGFVVAHGTDTLAYTASALFFMFEWQRKPVVVTGAQIAMGLPRSDGPANLAASIEVAAGHAHLNQVVVCFGSRILRGNRTTKVSSSSFDAFDSPMVPRIGEAGIAVKLEGGASYTRGRVALVSNPFQVFPWVRDPVVGCIRLFPGMDERFVKALCTSGVDGLVLQAYGSGTAPDRNKPLMKAIEEAVAGGVSVVAVSQTLSGGANLGSYEASSALRDCGVLDGRDMTTEAATTKLYYLLARGLSQAATAQQMNQSIRGEVSIPRPRVRLGDGPRPPARSHHDPVGSAFLLVEVDGQHRAVREGPFQDSLPAGSPPVRSDADFSLGFEAPERQWPRPPRSIVPMNPTAGPPGAGEEYSATVQRLRELSRCVRGGGVHGGNDAGSSELGLGAIPSTWWAPRWP